MTSVRRGRWLRLVTTATAVALAAVILTACTGSSDPTGAPDPSARDQRAVGHVHGIGTDPADGTLYAAGHFGLFRITDDGTPTRVADRWQDTMAFTVTGPNTFLASGHPDLREDLPPHLGLIESTDAGETWEPVSLEGEADFHALEVIGNRIVGYDAVSGQLMTTSDRQTWQTLDEGTYVDLAPAPGNSERVLATTASGDLVEVTVDGTSRTFTEAPELVWIDTAPDGTLVGATAAGEVFSSRQPQTGWRLAGRVPGAPTAIDAQEGVWHIATEGAILASTDNARTWRPILTFQH